MPRKLKRDMNSETEAAENPEPKAKLTFPNELIDELIAAAGGPSAVAGPDGLLKQLTAAVVNRALAAEMTHHLGYPKGSEPTEGQENRRNGSREKTVRTARGEIAIEVPRDREGTFEPQLVGKHQRAFDGFDDQIVSMYGRGMSTREIQSHLREIYGVDVSPDLISRVTDAIVDDVKAWQSRPLERVYAFVYLDALVVKIRDKGTVENKAVHVVVGVDLDGQRDVLGLWIERSEGAKFWMAVLNELRTRGVEDIFILCADGLTGLSAAAEAVFPKTIFQTCVVHMVRASTRYVPYRDLRAICADMRTLYTADSIESAHDALSAFEGAWGKRYPHAVRSWRDRFDEWSPFLAFPVEIRKAVYTTNAVEALNRQFRKTVKTRGPLPTDDAALKLLFLSFRNAHAKWRKGSRNWSVVRAQLAIHFGERFPSN
jgi:putative transposase